MATDIYYLCELSGAGPRDPSIPQFKLVKNAAVFFGEKAPNPENYTLIKNKKGQNITHRLAFEDGVEPTAEILPGAEVSVVEEVEKDKAGPTNVVRRWFVEFDDHTTAGDLRGCHFLDLSEASGEVKIGDTYWDFSEVPPKSKTFGEVSLVDDRPHEREFSDVSTCLYMSNVERIFEALKPKSDKVSPHAFVLRDSQGNRYNARLIFDEEKKVSDVQFKQADGYQSIGDALSRDCFNFTRDQLIVDINSEINKQQYQKQNIDNLRSQITYESITAEQVITIQDPNGGSDINLTLSYDHDSHEYSFTNDSDSVIGLEDLKGYFGQEKDYIVTLISNKQKEVKAQRLAANLEAVKTAAKVKSSPASFAIKNEKNEDVNVQLTCDKDGNVSGLKKNATSSMFWSSQRDLSSADYQALFGVDDINQLNVKLKAGASASPDASTLGYGSATLKRRPGRETPGDDVSISSSVAGSTPSAGDTIDPGTLTQMRKVLNTHKSPDEITAGTGDQAFTIERTKFIDGLDTSCIGKFDYTVNRGDDGPKTACVQLSAQKKGFHAKATTPPDGAPKDAQLVACALALAEGHLAEEVAKDPSATDNLKVNFTVHLGDKHHGKVDLIKNAIEEFYKALAEKNTDYTIKATVQFTGEGNKPISGKDLTVEPPSSFPAP